MDRLHDRERSADMGRDKGLSWRGFQIKGGSTLAMLALMDPSLCVMLAGASGTERVIPFLDQPPEAPEAAVKAFGELNKLDWEKLHDWITPTEQFFCASHYKRPVITPEDYRLEITGLVLHANTFALAELKQRPRQEVIFTLESAGNHGFDWFTGGIGTAKWVGTPLATLLKEDGNIQPPPDDPFLAGKRTY